MIFFPRKTFIWFLMHIPHYLRWKQICCRYPNRWLWILHYKKNNFLYISTTTVQALKELRNVSTESPNACLKAKPSFLANACRGRVLKMYQSLKNYFLRMTNDPKIIKKKHIWRPLVKIVASFFTHSIDFIMLYW